MLIKGSQRPTSTKTGVCGPPHQMSYRTEVTMRDSTPELEHKVAIVADRAFGDRLSDLAREKHVWIVESPMNSPSIEAVWAREPDNANADGSGPGVTSFTAADDETPEQMCLRLIDDIDAHHGESAHDPPWSEVQVAGAALTAALRTCFENIGARELIQTSDGFVCRR